MEKGERMKGKVTNQGSAGCLWVEEVDEWDEGEVQHGPDDIEFPMEVLNADGGDFDDL